MQSFYMRGAKMKCQAGRFLAGLCSKTSFAGQRSAFIAFAVALLLQPTVVNAAPPESVDDAQELEQEASGLSCIAAFNGVLPATFRFTPSQQPSEHLSEDHPERIVRLIAASAGIVASFHAYPAKMNGACATIIRTNMRVIYYGMPWLDVQSRGSYWVKVGILAHEIGHFINFHGPQDGKQPWEREYEADYFLGRTVRLMGGSLGDAVSAVARLPREVTSSHPPRALRIAAVKEGFESYRLPGAATPADVEPPKRNSRPRKKLARS